MKISLKLNKSLDENAQVFFKKAKKQRKKIPGAEIAIKNTEKKLEKLENSDNFEELKINKIKRSKKKKWFEKFRWFLTSNNFLVVAGRDANTNEDLIKKHVDKDDLVLHTDMAGSPFAVIKNNSSDKKITQKDIEESADFVLAYSRAWKAGFGNAEIFYVTPDQVSKTANQGEFLPKGSFMIRGKTNYIKNKINFCIGIYDLVDNSDYKNKVYAGPKESAKLHCSKFFSLIPGKQKTSLIAKKLKSLLSSDLHVDEFIRVIPSSSELKK